MRFHAKLELAGKTATGLTVPAEVVTALGSSKRPAVTVTINGYSYRSSIAPMNGVFMLPVAAEHRNAAGVAAGETIEIEIELDHEPRTVTIPADLAEALAKEPDAQRHFGSLSYSNKLRHMFAIEGAKSAETRQRRIEKAVNLFREGRN